MILASHGQKSKIIKVKGLLCYMLRRVGQCCVSAACSAVNAYRLRFRSMAQLCWTARQRQAPAAIKEFTHDCGTHDRFCTNEASTQKEFIVLIQRHAPRNIFLPGGRGCCTAMHTQAFRGEHTGTHCYRRAIVLFMFYILRGESGCDRPSSACALLLLLLAFTVRQYMLHVAFSSCQQLEGQP